jgi:hypothetical protein
VQRDHDDDERRRQADAHERARRDRQRERAQRWLEQRTNHDDREIHVDVVADQLDQYRILPL